MVMGMTVCPKVGVATCSPSTADSTLIAGVIMPSANRNPAPSIKSNNSNVVLRFSAKPKALARTGAAMAMPELITAVGTKEMSPNLATLSGDASVL